MERGKQLSNSFTLLVWDSLGVIASSENFGHWVTTQEAIETCRDLYPDSIALMHRASGNILWEDKAALALLS